MRSSFHFSGLFFNVYKMLCIVFVTVATFMYLYYACSLIHYGRRQLDAKPPIKSNQRICKDVLSSATQGTWRLRPHTSTTALEARRQLDMILRQRKGWPRTLWHGDLRCGWKFPLPRPNYINSSGSVIFDIQGQCDPQTDAPCCDGVKGWCGIGTSFCDCKNCIDFRNYLPAELSDWKPKSGCLVNNFSQTGACALINDHMSYITFMGDSLVRHLFSSVMLILTNDFKHGALKKRTPSQFKKFCRGDSQFIDSMCHVHIAMRWKDISIHPTFCPQANPLRFKLDFIEAYNIKHAPVALTMIKRQLSRRGSVVLLGIGIHNSFNASLVIESYLEPIVKLLSKSRNGWPHLIWLTTHSAGPLKPRSFYQRQGNHAILAYNTKLTDYCRRFNITVLDTFNMTRGVHSFDGTHYGFGVNMMKAQVVFNYLREKFGSKA